MQRSDAMHIEKTKQKPGMLDIVKIDSRWAQVAASPRDDGTIPVRFLSDNPQAN